MTGASTFIVAVWPFVRTSKTSGLLRISRDRDVARHHAAFSDLDARLSMAGSPPDLTDTVRTILLDLGLRTIEAVGGASNRRRANGIVASDKSEGGMSGFIISALSPRCYRGPDLDPAATYTIPVATEGALREVAAASVAWAHRHLGSWAASSCCGGA